MMIFFSKKKGDIFQIGRKMHWRREGGKGMVLYFQLSQANRKKYYITSKLCLTQFPQSKYPWLLNWHSHMVTPLTARQKVRDISIEAELLSSITLIPGGS